MADSPKPKNQESVSLRLANNSNIFFAGGLVVVLATLLIPLPTFLLDIGLSCSISFAIAVLIIVLSTKTPLGVITLCKIFRLILLAIASALSNAAPGKASTKSSSPTLAVISSPILISLLREETTLSNVVSIS